MDYKYIENTLYICCVFNMFVVRLKVEVCAMPFSYKPLWKLLIDIDMTKKDLMQLTGISKSTMDKMGRSEQVSLEILDRICSQLNCPISDIIEHKEN